MKRLIVLTTLSITLLFIGHFAAWRVEGDESRHHNINAAGHPRVIIVSEPALTHGIPHQYDTASSEAYDGIKEQLAASGIRVVDQDEFQPALLQEFTSPEMFFRGYSRLGLEKKADYILVYNVIRGKRESEGSLKLASATISTRVLDTASGQIREACHPEVTEQDKKTAEAAFKKAAREAGKKAAEYLVKLLDTIKRG